MIERAPVYQKSNFQKQVISTMSFKIIPTVKQTNSSKNIRHFSLNKNQTKETRTSKLYLPPPSAIISRIIQASSNEPSLLSNPKPNNETEKFNSQRMIKLSNRSKPVLRPVRKNSILANKDLLPQHSIAAKIFAETPLSSRSPSISPRIQPESSSSLVQPSSPLKVPMTILKPRDSLAFKNQLETPPSRPSSRNQKEAASRPDSRKSSISRTFKPPLSILKNPTSEYSSATLTKANSNYTKRRFSRSSFSSAVNEMNSTTGTINENVLNDICEQPKSHHLTSSLSTDAQYATLKVYEDIMHQRIKALFPHLDYLPRVSSARFSKSSVNTSSTSASKISSISSDKSSVNSSKQNKSQVEFSDEIRKTKVTHFIESAMKIIDAMDHFHRRKILNASSSDYSQTQTSSFPVIGRVVNLTNPGLLEEEDIIETYLKWIDLWNKYLDEQALS